MLNFCTLFETNYLSRGLALYESLEQQPTSFHLYILAFNDETFELLSKMKLKHASIIALKDFESPQLLAAKADRGIGEYCWTCTSSLIRYCLDQFQLDHCTYLDADLYFFSSPQPLIDEANDHAILITEHRYTAQYDQSELSGKYCVQFMYFKNNTAGRECLDWWADACIDWCYNRHEDGKFGDQKYLDDWLSRFKSVHELQHLGGGVAPWNIQQYEFSKEGDKIWGTETTSSSKFQLIFYHFHELKFLKNNQVNLCNYRLNKTDIRLIYKPYLAHINHLHQSIVREFNIQPFGISKQSPTFRSQLRALKHKMINSYHIYDMEDFA